MILRSRRGMDWHAGLFLALMIATAAFSGSLDHLMHWEPGRSMSTSSAWKGADGRPDPNVNKDNIWRKARKILTYGVLIKSVSTFALNVINIKATARYITRP